MRMPGGAAAVLLLPPGFWRAGLRAFRDFFRQQADDLQDTPRAVSTIYFGSSVHRIHSPATGERSVESEGCRSKILTKKT